MSSCRWDVRNITGSREGPHQTGRHLPREFAWSQKTVKVVRDRQHTSNRIRAFVLALAVVPALVAGALPMCAPGLCCPVAPDAPAVHSQMPCCSVEPSFVPRDAIRLQPATSAGPFLSPPTWAPVAVVAGPGADGFLPPRVQATLTTVSTAHHEPPPPLFLLNAQFLI